MPTIVLYNDFATDPIMAAAGFGDTARFSQALVEQVLDEAEMDTPDPFWGDLQARAIKYLTAHRLTMLTQADVIGTGGATGIAGAGIVKGNIQSISASQGSQSVSYGRDSSFEGSGEGITSTYWGLQWLKLRGRLVITGTIY